MTAVQAFDILSKTFRHISDYRAANDSVLRISGMHEFFRDEKDFSDFFARPQADVVKNEEPIRREYGDFQTPAALTDTICAHLVQKGVAPHVLLEPTFGKGAFLLSALRAFPTLKAVYGIEIYEPYYWETKYKILELFLNQPDLPKPDIFLFQADVFHFDFRHLQFSTEDRLLILGNPPWVTNAELGNLNSRNLPRKRNFKSLRGIDALTGQSNFDISEAITHKLLERFSHQCGHLAFLVKNTVIRNLVRDLPESCHKISQIQALKIDTQKVFNAAVDAALLEADLGAEIPEMTCTVTTTPHPAPLPKRERECPPLLRRGARGEVSEYEFGWTDQKFVANIQLYQQVRFYDGQSPYVWRQGVKHDCAKIMELERSSLYRNGLHEEVELEDDLIYGLVKSSDLHRLVIEKPRKAVIITQKKPGAETSSLMRYPKLYGYLEQHRSRFEQRKSSIYNHQPPFAIFGIGEYAFKPYKVAISGLYKQARFALVLPENGKPCMVDDTCYFLSFDELPEAVIVWAILNSETVQNLLRALTFLDSKRPYTKHVLMRVAIDQIAQNLSYQEVFQQIHSFDERFAKYLTEDQWYAFVKKEKTYKDFP
jgi:hypothetical protein